jgi:hypothetical protein
MEFVLNESQDLKPRRPELCLSESEENSLRTEFRLHAMVPNWLDWVCNTLSSMKVECVGATVSRYNDRFDSVQRDGYYITPELRILNPDYRSMNLSRSSFKYFTKDLGKITLHFPDFLSFLDSKTISAYFGPLSLELSPTRSYLSDSLFRKVISVPEVKNNYDAILEEIDRIWKSTSERSEELVSGFLKEERTKYLPNIHACVMETFGKLSDSLSHDFKLNLLKEMVRNPDVFKEIEYFLKKNRDVLHILNDEDLEVMALSSEAHEVMDS